MADWLELELEWGFYKFFEIRDKLRFGRNNALSWQ